MGKVSYITNLDRIPQLSADEKERLRSVGETYAFRANSYYLGLIDWSDPNDPIRRIVIPSEDELLDWGRLDASDEEQYTVVPGLEHKYEGTAVLLVNDLCGGFCRFCFRKRLFMNTNEEVVRDVSGGLDYIREHPEINNVLLSGGDPLLLSSKRLHSIIRELRSIDHVQIVRIGSKLPVFNPYRVLDDPTLLETLDTFSTPEKRIYILVHFNHPREITPQAANAMDLLHRTGVVIANQTPLLRGINDDPEVLRELFSKLSYIGVPPYYVFIGRPTVGNRLFAIPVEEALEIFEQGRVRCSGLAKRARLVMSHATGKIEVVGKTDSKVYFRYHRAADFGGRGRFMVFDSNPQAFWFDEYDEVMEEYSYLQPLRCIGPE